MGACLLDLIPDVEEIFKKVSHRYGFRGYLKKVLCDVKTEYGVEVTFPVAPFSVVLGFGLILITEQAVLHFQVPPILEHPLASFSQEQMVVGVREERQPLMHSTPG